MQRTYLSILVMLFCFIAAGCGENAIIKEEPIKKGDVLFDSDAVSVKLVNYKVVKILLPVEHDYLKLYFEITNSQKDKKVQFESWSPMVSKLSKDKNNTKALDEFENSYSVVPCADETECRKSIMPGESIEDIVYFMAVIPTSRKYTVTLQGNEVTDGKNLVFTVAL